MQFFDSELCARCKGKGLCGKPCRILSKIKGYFPKKKTHFSGSSPPEIFIGRYNYPNINAGILSPEQIGQTEEMSMPEIWHEKNFGIEDIASRRMGMVYSRFKTGIKDAKKPGKFVDAIQQISMADKSVSTEFFLQKAPTTTFNLDSHTPLIGNPAPLKLVNLQENPHIPKKVDYLVSDTNAKANQAIKELYKGKTIVSHLAKLLSAGVLGIKYQRKFVPTRWSITAVDDTLSKMLLEKIRYYPEISEILLFNSEYLGNHYEFLLLPDKFSFEVIEAKMSGSVWNPFSQNTIIMKDYEEFHGRKKYASEVTGAYYSNRLALAEYLESIKRQALCIVMREARPEYSMPMGVGILREASRAAFRKIPEKFATIEEAFATMQTRMRLPTSLFKQHSFLLKNYKKQTRISQWF